MIFYAVRYVFAQDCLAVAVMLSVCRQNLSAATRTDEAAERVVRGQNRMEGRLQEVVDLAAMAHSRSYTPFLQPPFSFLSSDLPVKLLVQVQRDPLRGRWHTQKQEDLNPLSPLKTANLAGYSVLLFGAAAAVGWVDEKDRIRLQIAAVCAFMLFLN